MLRDAVVAPLRDVQPGDRGLDAAERRLAQAAQISQALTDLYLLRDRI